MPGMEDASETHGSPTRTYVAHGDKVWGNSITHRQQEDGKLDVSGWLARAPFPEEGDELLVRMQSGRWGIYVFEEVQRARGVSDMFHGIAYPTGEYAETEPQTDDEPDELIPTEQKSVFSR